MEWPNRRQMIHSQQKWIYISDSSRTLCCIMHDNAYVKMLELFGGKLIWHQWEFVIWYRLYHFGPKFWSDIDVQTLFLKNLNFNYWRHRNSMTEILWQNPWAKIVLDDLSEFFLDKTLRLILFCPIFSWLTP